MYINVHLQPMERRGTSDRIQYQDGVIWAVLSIDHTYGMPTYKLSQATCLHGQ